MPLLPVIVVVGLAGAALLSSRKKPEDKKSGSGTGLPDFLNVDAKSSGIAVGGGATTFSARNWQDAAGKVAGIIGDAVFETDAARGIVKYGVPIALAVGLVNWVAGLIVLAAVWLAALVTDIADYFYTVTHDNHQEGLDEFESRWQDVYKDTRNHILSAASVSGNYSEHDVDVAASAYADGMLRHVNYLSILRWAFAHNITGMEGVNIGWRKGKFASAVLPLPSDAAYRWMYLHHGLVASDAQSRFGSTVGGVFLNEAWQTEFNANTSPRLFHDGGFPALHMSATDSKTQLARTWFRMGELHANAAQFLTVLNTPWGIGQTLDSHLDWHSKRGFFGGDIRKAPTVPQNVGIGFGASECYAPYGNATIVFTQVASV